MEKSGERNSCLLVDVLVSVKKGVLSSENKDVILACLWKERVLASGKKDVLVFGEKNVLVDSMHTLLIIMPTLLIIFSQCIPYTAVIFQPRYK